MVKTMDFTTTVDKPKIVKPRKPRATTPKQPKDTYQTIIIPNSNAEVQVYKSGKVVMFKKPYIGKSSKYTKYLISLSTTLFKKGWLEEVEYKITFEKKKEVKKNG